MLVAAVVLAAMSGNLRSFFLWVQRPFVLELQVFPKKRCCALVAPRARHRHSRKLAVVQVLEDGMDKLVGQGFELWLGQRRSAWRGCRTTFVTSLSIAIVATNEAEWSVMVAGACCRATAQEQCRPSSYRR